MPAFVRFLRHAGGVALVSLLAAAPGEAQVRHVLLLQSLDRGSTPYDTITSNLLVDVDARAGRPVTFSQVVVNPSGFGVMPEDAVITYLDNVYAGRAKPDLVITIGGPAAAFTRRHRKQIFPESPVLYTMLDERFAGGAPLAAHEAAITSRNNPAANIEDILQLFPDTTNVFVVLGSGALSRLWRREFERAFAPLRDRVTFTWSDAMSFNDVLRHVAALPPRSAVFHFSFSTDTQGSAYPDARALPDLRAASAAPVFGMHGPQLGLGIVGGRLMPVTEISRATTEAALRILDGESPGTIRIPPFEMGRPVYDWRELQRWGVSESRLPPGSDVRFRPPGIWQQFKWTIVAVAVALAAQTALIGALLVHRARLKAARASLSNLSARLIDAQEQERRRVARELHDDVGQRMALLNMELGQLRRLPGSDARAQEMVDGVADSVTSLVSDIQGISRRLHSAKLEYLGLEAAARSLCEEISVQHGVPIHYSHDDVPAGLPPDVALNVFRILQEALANAVKHAGARRYAVTLSGHGGALVLEVTDDGRGFDAAGTLQRGLGLVSMQERIKLVGGRVDITSRPGSGTTVRARVPLQMPAA